ncbi:transporter substrate-binding domain-containing protein [Colwellia ponticola]|uniref:Transporter substrate-binding domain-containing protein n=1 Tax=Colwellia ponticola TaxID=2304625 RepID=A0A8H2JLH7_9GAMM|nr:transporter substrate-binding domain-containing protein [Colwellia ponticola]
MVISIIKILTVSIISLLIIICVALFYSYAESNWWQPKYSVTIAVSKTPLSTPFYVAKAIGAFDKTCVNVKFDNVVGGQKAFTKVMTGDVDFGTSSDSVIAFQSLANKGFVTHAMFVQSNNDVKFLSRSSEKVDSVFDLKGKKIGVIQGTASEYFVSILLALEGLTTEDVTLRYYKPEALINGFINNEVDAFVPWEPFAFNSTKQLRDKVKVHNTKNLNSLSFNLISLTADNLLVEKAKCIIQGLSIATDYIAGNQEESKQIVMRELNLSAAFIEWVWPDYIFKLALNQSLIFSVQSQAIWAVATQMSEFEKVSDVERFIDSRAMLQVIPNAVNVSQ